MLGPPLWSFVLAGGLGSHGNPNGLIVPVVAHLHTDGELPLFRHRVPRAVTIRLMVTTFGDVGVR